METYIDPVLSFLSTVNRRPAYRGALRATVLPEAARAKLEPWLQHCGHEVAAPDEPAPVAVIDVRGPAGAAALRALREDPLGSDISVLAVVSDLAEDGPEALRLGADELIAVDAIERELATRLECVGRLARLRAQQADRELDLASLLRLVLVGPSPLDPATLLDELRRRLAGELAPKGCSLVLIPPVPDAGYLVAPGSDGAPDAFVDLSRYPELAEAVQGGRPVVVPPHGAPHPLLGESSGDGDLGALAAVPLSSGSSVLGVLLLRAANGRSFSARALGFAWTVAQAAAVALANSRLAEGLREQLKRAEERIGLMDRYEELFKHLSEGLLILDETADIVSVNPTGAQILGIEPDRALGKPFAAFATPRSETAMMELLGCVRRGLVCRNVELQVRSADDRVLTLSVCGSLAPKGPGILLSFRDVTDARAADQDGRKESQLYERLLDVFEEAVVAADPKGRILVYNRAAERLFGYTPAEARAHELAELLAEGPAREGFEGLRAVDRGCGRLDPFQGEIVARDGTRVPVLVSASLLADGDRPLATLGVFRDLRDQDSLKAKLEKTEEKLAQAEKRAVLIALAGAAAHELNQPLTAVMGFAEMLKRRLNEGDPAYQHVDIIYHEAVRMAEIVRKIGKITRYETKSYVGGLEIVDLDRAAGDDE